MYSCRGVCRLGTEEGKHEKSGLGRGPGPSQGSSCLRRLIRGGLPIFLWWRRRTWDGTDMSRCPHTTMPAGAVRMPFLEDDKMGIFCKLVAKSDPSSLPSPPVGRVHVCTENRPRIVVFTIDPYGRSEFAEAACKERRSTTSRQRKLSRKIGSRHQLSSFVTLSQRTAGFETVHSLSDVSGSGTEHLVRTCSSQKIRCHSPWPGSRPLENNRHSCPSQLGLLPTSRVLVSLTPLTDR